MIGLSLLLAAQGVPQSLLDEADAASLAHVECLFAMSRQAHAAGLSATQFESNLATACLREGRALQRVSTKIFALRGRRDPAAEAEQMLRESRRGIVDGYRKIPDIEAKLEELGEVCRARPEACRD